MTIRRIPDDFQVDELLTDAAQNAIGSAPAGHALYQLTKTSMTTPDALRDLARALRVPQSALAFVGLKDKHAHTTQYVSLPQRGDLPSEITGASWAARRLGFLPRALQAEDVAGNRFTLVVRDISHETARLMEHHAHALAVAPDELLIVNYFGDQRFGSNRHFAGFAGPHLVRGEFAQALKLTIATPSRKDKKNIKLFRQLLARHWGDFRGVLDKLPRCPDRRAIEHLARRPDDFATAWTLLPYFTQQMAVYAWQSHLWNDLARRLMPKVCPDPNDRLVVDDDFGKLIFVPAHAVEPRWRELPLPVPGRSTQPVEPWIQAAAEVCHDAGLSSFKDLRIPGIRRPFFGEAERTLFITAKDFALRPIQTDELSPDKRRKRIVSFRLPRGGYATIVLRALGQ